MKKVFPFLLFLITLAGDQYIKYLFWGEVIIDFSITPESIVTVIVFMVTAFWLFKSNSITATFRWGTWLLISGFTGTILNNRPIYYDLNLANIIVVISAIIVLLSLIIDERRGKTHE